MAEPNFSKWHGMDRAGIPWYPIIDEKKCTGCGMCVVTCSEKRNVFGFDVEKKKALVLYPNNCMVGCNNCQISCLWNAISYPENALSQIKDLAKELVDSKVIENELRARLQANVVKQ